MATMTSKRLNPHAARKLAAYAPAPTPAPTPTAAVVNPRDAWPAWTDTPAPAPVDAPAPPEPAPPARKGKGKPKAPDLVRLSLTIRGVVYAARVLRVDPESGASKLLRLRKASGECYHVAMTDHGPTCDCGDQTWRHEGRDALGCKHIRACRATGLIGDAGEAPR